MSLFEVNRIVANHTCFKMNKFEQVGDGEFGGSLGSRGGGWSLYSEVQDEQISTCLLGGAGFLRSQA